MFQRISSGLSYSLSGVNVFSESIRYWDPVKQPSGNRYGGMIAEATFHHGGYDTRTETYSYDGFKRITGTASYIGSETSPGTVNVENGISYDAMGNVTSLNRHGPSGAATAQLTMSYSGNHCTQVYDSVSDQSWTNTYREDGTLLSDPRTGFKYADNLLGQVSQVAVIPLLPGPGNLVLVNSQSSYLPDGTKIESGSFSKKLYREGFIYAKPFIGNATLESVQLPGVLVSVADTVWRPLAWITDHLGSVRALADMKAGMVVERNDYHTYGTRITKPTSTASTYPSLFANRWRYAGKEEQSGVNDLVLDDFGARLFNPFTASWIAPDPLAGNTPWISPYAYCAGNPVNLVDVDGRDLWEVNKAGKIERKESSEEHILYLVDDDNNRNVSLRIKEREVLDYFTNNNIGVASFTSKNSSDLKNLFVFLSDNTSIEWALHKSGEFFTLGTVHNTVNAGSWWVFGVANRPDISYHSHPNIDTDLNSEVWSMSADYSNMKKNPDLKAKQYYIYFPSSRSVYLLTPTYYYKEKKTIYQKIGITKRKK